MIVVALGRPEETIVPDSLNITEADGTNPKTAILVPLIFILGCSLTILSYLRLVELRELNTREHLSSEARSLFIQIERELSEYEGDLSNINRFYQSSNEVTESEFLTFVTPLFQLHSGFEEILWLPKIDSEVTLSMKGDSGSIGSKALVSYPITYSLQRSAAPVLNAEVFRNESVRALLDRAMEGGTLLSSPPLSKLGISASPAFEGYLLVQPTSVGDGDALASGKSPRGLIVARLRLAEVFRPWADEQNSLPFSLSEIDDAVSSVVYRSAKFESAHQKYELRYPLVFANRNLEIGIRPSQEYLALLISDGGLLILIFGLLGSFLLAFVTSVVLQRSQYVQRIVGERTNTLKRFNAELEKRVEERTIELESSRKDALDAVANLEKAEAQLSLYAEVLREQNNDLEKANKELDEFVYTVSHDLKEPLHGLKICSTFLREDYGEVLSAAGCSELDTIGVIVQSMEQLMETLLHYSSIARVDMPLQHEPLGEIVNDVIALLSGRIRDEGVDIRIEENLPGIFCHRELISDLLQNLITNGIKYNNSAPKKIIIGSLTKEHTQCPDDDRDFDSSAHDVFFVQDNGIGIAEKDQALVFQIFRRLHAEDEYRGGSGAGLTIVKKIVERHHGRIWLDSSPGEGSTFFVAIPKIVV